VGKGDGGAARNEAREDAEGERRSWGKSGAGPSRKNPLRRRNGCYVGGKGKELGQVGVGS